MTMRSHLGELRKFIRIARDIRHNINLAVNEELFWNQYVKEWEKSEKNKDIQVLRDGMETRRRFSFAFAKVCLFGEKGSRNRLRRRQNYGHRG